MSRSSRARWWNASAYLAGAVVAVGVMLILGRPLFAVALAVALLVAAVYTSPLRADTSTAHWDAQEAHVRDGTVIVYWRPGCPFCLRLRLSLGMLARRAVWVDIWADPEGAAFVRDVNDGAESVPTVILPDGTAVTNPDPDRVREALHRRAAA